MSYKVRVLSVWSLPGLAPLLCAGMLALTGAMLLLTTGPAQAESNSGKSRNQVLAEKLMTKGAAAVAAKDFATAQSSLTDAYRAYQSPKILYHLGTLRAAEQKTVEAQDLLRRFLADSTVEPSEPLRQQAQKLLASLPAADSGEVQVGAPRGAEVMVDGKAVGALPLPLPLLLASGSHQLLVQQGKWRAATEAMVKTARLLELRFTAGSEVVLATEPPMVLVIDSYPEPAMVDTLRKSILGVIRRENLAPVLGSVALESVSELATTPGCLADPDCQHRLASKFGFGYVLSAQNHRGASDPKSLRIELELYDLAVAANVATKSAACEGCTTDAAAGKLADAVAALLSEANNRGRGELEITSTPTDADVLLDGRVIGKTPLKKGVLTGSYALEVRKGEFRAEPQRITVGPSEPARATFTLVAESEVEPPPSETTTASAIEGGRRPRSRIATGAAAMGVGALFVGLGASAMSIDGQCVNKIPNTDGLPPNCTDQHYFMTGTPGLGLTISGAVLLVGGAVLLALPASVGGQLSAKSARRSNKPADLGNPLAGTTSSSVLSLSTAGIVHPIGAALTRR